MVSSYEEAYRQFNPSAKPTNSLDKATQNLLNGLKKKIKEAGGWDADIEKVRDNIKLELSVDKEYKDRRKALENLPDAVKKQNPDLFQQARDEKNALRP